MSTGFGNSIIGQPVLITEWTKCLQLLASQYFTRNKKTQTAWSDLHQPERGGGERQKFYDVMKGKEHEGGKKGREVLGWYGIRNEHLSIESL